MAKKPTAEHGRGEIRDNALKALVTSKLFQVQIVKAKKGKGSYSRQKFKQGQNNDYSALVVFSGHSMAPSAFSISASATVRY